MIHDLNSISLFDLIGKSRAVYLEHTVGFSQYSLLVWREIYHTVGTRAEKNPHFKTVQKTDTAGKTQNKKEKVREKSSYMMTSNELFSKPASVRASMKPWTKFTLGFW